MTNRKQLIQRCALATLACAASIPAMIACGGSKDTGTGAASPSASYATQPGYPPPGYAQQPGAYPQQPGAYPQQPGAYPQQPGAYPQPGQPGVPPGATAAAPAGSTPAPLGSVTTTDPNALAQLIAQAAAAGSAFLTPPGGATVGDPVAAGVAAVAAKHAAGEQPEGQMAKGNLQQGGHLAFTVTMQAGKCYTIVGFSPTIKNVDLVVLAPPFYNTIAGQDVTDNNTPSVGATPHPLCPITPFPLQYKVDISARNGAGDVGVQMYSKNK